MLSLPTAYVVRGKVMFWHVSVHPSIHPSVCPHLGGVPQPGPAGGGGTPTGGVPNHQTWPGGGGTLMGGTPPQVPPVRPGWGVPHLGYPPVRPGWGAPWWGYPTSGTSHWTWLGVPWWGYPTLGTPGRPGRGVPWQGVPWWGVPCLKYPPHWTWPGGTPPWIPPNWTWLGGVPRWGGYPTSGGTWYTAVGMPLAFTQEDFLVYLWVPSCLVKQAYHLSSYFCFTVFSDSKSYLD